MQNNTCRFLSFSRRNKRLQRYDLCSKQFESARNNPKAIPQINSARNLIRVENTTMFFIIEEVKETVPDFSQGNVKVL